MPENVEYREKLVKDNVHGYIYIDERFFRIIDTPNFQRLKNIKQTSYTSLYPSATHDRFTHSLGTFHLANQVIENLFENINKSKTKIELPFGDSEIKSIKFTFKVAALLHDVGHAPFSHTCENFFQVKKIENSFSNFDSIDDIRKKVNAKPLTHLDGLLINEIAGFYGVEELNPDSDKTVYGFAHDFIKSLNDGVSKPHEKMSALVALKFLANDIKSVSEVFGNEKLFDADLFVRSIIGVKYEVKGRNKEVESFRNIVISLLNSDTIDVDKLDYIMRDAYMTGFKNVSIDIERLLNSFSAIKDDDKFYLVYKKNSLSVIENVLAAGDANNKWIVNHPIIVYDTYLTQRCIYETFRIMAKEKISSGKNEDEVFLQLFEEIFSLESMSLEGKALCDGKHISLLSDMDIICFFKDSLNSAKDEFQKNIFKEYFDRNERRHPLWKSEMEFSALFASEKPDISDRIECILAAVKEIEDKKDEKTNISFCFVNSDNYDKYKTENAEAFIKAVKKYFDERNKKFDILVISISSASSKMLKLNKSSLYVELPCIGYESKSTKNYCVYSKIVGEKKSPEPKRMFYFYSKERLDAVEFVHYLLCEADL